MKLCYWSRDKSGHGTKPHQILITETCLYLKFCGFLYYSECNASKTFLKSSDRRQKKNSQKTPVCSIPQINRLIDNRLWHHGWVLKWHPQKTLAKPAFTNSPTV